LIFNRKELIASGADNLDLHSLRMKAAGLRNREKFAAAFVDTMSAEGGDLEVFRMRCKGYGISPMLIFLLLGIAWDVLYYWWTHRESLASPYKDEKMPRILLLAIALALMSCGITRAECPCDCSDCTCPKDCADCPVKVAVPADGQLSPRGQWQWSSEAWAWLPVQRSAVTHRGQSHLPKLHSDLKPEASACVNCRRSEPRFHGLGPRAWQSARYRR
jgi:hypothetical protein